MNSEIESKYSYAVVHENGNELAYSRYHAEAIMLNGLALGWEYPVVIAFPIPLNEADAANALKSLRS